MAILPCTFILNNIFFSLNLLNRMFEVYVLQTYEIFHDLPWSSMISLLQGMFRKIVKMGKMFWWITIINGIPGGRLKLLVFGVFSKYPECLLHFFHTLKETQYNWNAVFCSLQMYNTVIQQLIPSSVLITASALLSPHRLFHPSPRPPPLW